jgi:hypothetical protein
MITGPSQTAPVVSVAAAAAVTDARAVWDLDAGTVEIIYLQGHRTIPRHPIPPALLTAMRAHVVALIEAKEGWAPGSAVVT